MLRVSEVESDTSGRAAPTKRAGRQSRSALKAESRTGPEAAGSAFPHELPAIYRERASQLLRYAPAAAEAFNEAAELLEAALGTLDAEPLTPEQIEAEGLCSAETVRRHVREQKIENVGSAGRIQVRRADVPARRGKRTFAELAREVARSSR